ncbi:MAG: hypothetical protein LIP01_15000 [Tannerellaceae bacterium]|nr:hypothetical protein [Tannerellaceae bacterium]
MKRMFPFLLLLVLLIGCKTFRQVEVQNDIRKEWEGELLSSSLSNILISGTGKEMITHNLSGHVRIWSPPDSSGSQYPVADIDFNRKTKEEREQAAIAEVKDSTTIQARARNHEEDHSSRREVSQSDNRIFHGESIVCIILLLILIVYLFRKFYN